MVNANARSTRWPRLLDILAVALVFNLCAAAVAASTRAAEPEPTTEPVAVVALYTQVEQPFRAGQGERVGKARKAAPVYETTEHVAKGAGMSIFDEPKALEVANQHGDTGTYINRLRLMTHDELLGELVEWALDTWRTQLDAEPPEWYEEVINHIADAAQEKHEAQWGAGR